MLKRFVRAFSGWTVGEVGRSAWSVAVEGREAGLAYSLTGRGEVGGASEVALLGLGGLSSLWWLVSGLGGCARSSTLRRWSRGMAGMRYYYIRERGHLAVLCRVVYKAAVDV